MGLHIVLLNLWELPVLLSTPMVQLNGDDMSKKSYIWNSKINKFEEVKVESDMSYADIVAAEEALTARKREKEEKDQHSGNYI